MHILRISLPFLLSLMWPTVRNPLFHIKPPPTSMSSCLSLQWVQLLLTTGSPHWGLCPNDPLSLVWGNGDGWIQSCASLWGKHSCCESVRKQFPSIPPSSLAVPEPWMGNRGVPLGTNTAQLLFAPLWPLTSSVLMHFCHVSHRIYILF